MLETVEAARRYAALGYRVLPLEAGRKNPDPRLREWFPLTEAWRKAHPEADVGILPPREVLVLDVDLVEAWEALRAEYPELEKAPRQRTPRGGVHLFLRIPQGWRAGPKGGGGRRFS